MAQAPEQLQPPAGALQQGPGGPGGQGGPFGAGPRRQRPPRPDVPPEFDGLAIWKMEPAKLVALLKDPASTEFQKAIAMKKLAFVGGKECVPLMAAHLGDPHLCAYARMGLEGNPDPSADDALRAALPKVTGLRKVGVITSIGYHKDVKAMPSLVALISDKDPQVAGAAATSVALIGGAQAATALRSALDNTTAPAFPVIARATLVCADNMLNTNKARALGMFTVLSRDGMPQPVQLSALRVLNAATPAPPGTKKWVAPKGPIEPRGGFGRPPGQAPAQGGQRPPGGNE